MPRVEMVIVPQVVSVRKHEVDMKGLCNLLRSHRTMTNRQIANELGIPLTEVEHWFRQDEWQCVPDPSRWQDIKQLLGITSTEYDAQVTEFEQRYGVFEKAERCYKPSGIAPTLTTFDGGGVKVITDDI